MGKVYSLLTRPLRTFNIENRAERIISRDKPIPAPQYPATEKQKKLSEQINPHFLEDHYQKNVQLDQRLKDVFVTSTDSQVKQELTKESKLLPQSRHKWDNDSRLESYESTMIPMGKCSLKQALAFLLQHKRDPTYNSETIASEYKLDKRVVDDILKYFKLYVTVSPDNPTPTEEDPIQDALEQAIELKKKDKEKE